MNPLLLCLVYLRVMHHNKLTENTLRMFFYPNNIQPQQRGVKTDFRLYTRIKTEVIAYEVHVCGTCVSSASA